MRGFGLVLLAALVSSGAFAQSSGGGGAPAATETPKGLTADGKIMLGLEGRGNYRKPKSERITARADGQMKGSDFEKAMLSDGAAATSSSTAVVTAKDAAAEQSAQKRGLHGDKALLSSAAALNPTMVPESIPASTSPTTEGNAPPMLGQAPVATSNPTAATAETPKKKELKSDKSLRSDKSLLTPKPVAAPPVTSPMMPNTSPAPSSELPMYPPTAAH